MKHNLKTLILAGSSVFAMSLVLPLALSSTAGATGWDDNNQSKHAVQDNQQKDRHQKKDYQKDDQKDHKRKDYQDRKESGNNYYKQDKDHKREDHKEKKNDHKHNSQKQDGHKKHHQNKSHQRAAANQQLHRKLDALLREHAALGVAALKAELLESPDANALMQAVEDNNQAVANTVGKFYPGTKGEFLHLWRQHIQYYVDYLHAAKENDDEGKQEAKQNLAKFVKRVTNLLNEAKPQLDQHRLKHQLTMHGDQVVMVIDSLVEGDYKTAHQIAHQAYMHMGAVADTLALTRSSHSSTH